jgi:hypothetical protein
MAGNNLSWLPRINATRVVAVTPTISTSPAYTSGDQIGGIMTLTDVIRQDKSGGFGTSELVGVTILDKALQSAAMSIWLFNQSPTLASSDNAAFNISDANLVLQCIGVVSVGTAYSASAANSVSSTQNLNKIVQIPYTATSPTNVYAVAVIGAAATYTTTTDLQFQFEFFVD